MKGWTTKPLGEVAEFINGRAFKPSDWSSIGVPIIRIQNLTDPTAPANRFDGTYDERHAVKDSDLLVSWSATLDVFVWDRGNAVLNQHIFRVVPDFSRVSKTYLFYALKSVMDELRSKTHGATMKHITKGPFERTEIPVPPLAEQERIVKLLDEADELRKLRAQAVRRTADLIPALFHEMFGDEIAENSKPLSEVCQIITDGVHITPTYVDEGVPFLRVTDIQDAEIDWVSVKRIPEKEYEQITRRVKPGRGDILYSKNGTIGIAKEITWDRPFAHFVSLALLRLNLNLLNPTFVAAWLNTPDALAQAVRRSKTGTVTNLHLNEIKKLHVPCPSMETQAYFVRRVTEIGDLEAEQTASRRRVEDLFQSMLHLAFRGEL
jgi:type I restriction enzyme S subunit